MNKGVRSLQQYARVVRDVVRDEPPDPIEIRACHRILRSDLRNLRMRPDRDTLEYLAWVKRDLCAQLVDELVKKLDLLSDDRLMNGGEMIEVGVVLHDLNAYERWHARGSMEGAADERKRQEAARPYGLDEVYE
tara:strand:+ start:3067 stop:3468 length:402 start_codon:yes stop_codon:yes gene_type:complete